MSPKYVVHYFDSKGRAEVIRWMFALKGVDYEDKRYTREEWVDFKTKTPYGQMPVLEVDGKMLCQTNAILLYLTQVFDLNGETPMTAAEGVMILGCLEEAMKLLLEAFFSPVEEIKAAKMKEFLEQALPKFLKFLTSQHAGKEWLTGSKMTVTDLTLARFVSDLPQAAKDIVKNYPEVQALSDKVLSLPAIKAWLEKRPVTAM